MLTEMDKLIIRVSLVAYQAGVPSKVNSALWELRQEIPFDPRKDIHNACDYVETKTKTICFMSDEKAEEIAARYGVRL